MKKYEALQVLAKIVREDDLIVTSVGSIKNEWHSLMPGDGTMFLSLMGGVVPFAFGLAIALPHRRIFAFDTDGSFLMNIGALCTLVNEHPRNLSILVFDNEIHEAVGGHPTHTQYNVDLERLATGIGISVTATIRASDELWDRMSSILNMNELAFIVLKIEPGKHSNIPPERAKKSDGLEDKYRFIRFVEKLERVCIRSLE